MPAPTIEFWDRRLELMHHYSLVTVNTLSIRPEMQHVWRITIPEIGYSFPFVMQGILAVAAVHKAYLTPPWSGPRTSTSRSPTRTRGSRGSGRGCTLSTRITGSASSALARSSSSTSPPCPCACTSGSPKPSQNFWGSLSLCGGHGRSSNRTRRSSVARTWRPWPPLLRPSNPAVQLRV
jgi:hypothetical protein